ncbi:MAG: helix-turn-helix domain-containing protein [Burkholderiales bacterium]|nr:helix-turn-helix domain-containing protein [Phycisphaerae bacterium]
MESIGKKIRRARLRLGLTLDELAGRSSISKPYLSLIETGRVSNPPSDPKLRSLEQTLGFTTGELVGQAHLMRTPRDVREMLNSLLSKERGEGEDVRRKSEDASNSHASRLSPLPSDLDSAYTSGMLHELVERSVGNVENVRMNAIPIVNRVSAGYPKDFTDLSYPRGVADDYVGCPDLHDPDAFAARVHGDSMSPKYQPGDIVIFSPAAANRPGDDCFVRFDDGQTTFKRVFFEQNEHGESILRLQPRNEKYRPQVVKPELVTGLYRAMYRYQSVEE